MSVKPGGRSTAYREGYHHVSIPITMILLLTLGFFAYRVFVVNDFFGRIMNNVAESCKVGETKSGSYLVTVIPPEGKKRTFTAEGKVKVERNRIVITFPGQVVYYPIPKNSQVIVREVE